MTQKKKVLVFRTGHLGDTVCAIPAFRLLRQHFKDDKLMLLCDQPRNGKVAATEVCAKLNVFDQMLVYRSGLGIVTAFEVLRQIRTARPDILVLLPQVRESQSDLEKKKTFFRWCGIKNIIGHNNFQTGNVWCAKEPDRLVEMLYEYGMRGTKPAYQIPVDVAAQAAVVEKLRSTGINPTQPFTLFCGGGTVSTQRWPLARYAAVLQAITQETDWPVIGIGSPKEVLLYQSEVKPIFPALCLLEQALSIGELFELCRLATVYLGNDTGPMHVAAAAACPVVAIISARNSPGMWDPDVEPSLVIRHRMECENCFLADCVAEQHRCMTAITTDRVITELIPFIKSLAPRCSDSAYTNNGIRTLSS